MDKLPAELKLAILLDAACSYPASLPALMRVSRSFNTVYNSHRRLLLPVLVEAYTGENYNHCRIVAALIPRPLVTKNMTPSMAHFSNHDPVLKVIRNRAWGAIVHVKERVENKVPAEEEELKAMFKTHRKLVSILQILVPGLDRRNNSVVQLLDPQSSHWEEETFFDASYETLVAALYACFFRTTAFYFDTLCPIDASPDEIEANGYDLVLPSLESLFSTPENTFIRLAFSADRLLLEEIAPWADSVNLRWMHFYPAADGVRFFLDKLATVENVWKLLRAEGEEREEVFRECFVEEGLEPVFEWLPREEVDFQYVVLHEVPPLSERHNI